MALILNYWKLWCVGDIWVNGGLWFFYVKAALQTLEVANRNYQAKIDRLRSDFLAKSLVFSTVGLCANSWLAPFCFICRN
jgi:hypothetical protein